MNIQHVPVTNSHPQLGMLAAPILFEKSDFACCKIAKALTAFGSSLGLEPPTTAEGSWLFVKNIHEKLLNYDLDEFHPNNLAARYVYKLLSQSLKPLVEKISHSSLITLVVGGETLREQYYEGLITEDEFLVKLIDEVSKV